MTVVPLFLSETCKHYLVLITAIAFIFRWMSLFKLAKLFDWHKVCAYVYSSLQNNIEEVILRYI